MRKKKDGSAEGASMGVVEFLCIPTGDRFVKAVIDTKEIEADSFRLDANLHPNAKLQRLWRLYGDAGFSKRIASSLEPGSEDPSGALRELLEAYLREYPDAERI